MASTADLFTMATGRWKNILLQCGVAEKFLRDKHGPCPMCGGKDRFRFDDKEGSGSYYCNQCGPGNGFTFLRKWLKTDDKTVFRELEKILPKLPAEIITPAEHESKRNLIAVKSIIRGATSPSVVDRYHAQRGLSVTSEILLGHPACPYYDDRNKHVANHPAVIVPVVDKAGELLTVQRVYLADVSPRKKSMPPTTRTNGWQVRLFPAGETMGVAEGYETALACHQIWNIPVWATLSDQQLIHFSPPGDCRRLLIFGDNDENYVGQAAAFTLARKLALGNDRSLVIEVHIPHRPGTDWLDEI